MGQKIPASVSGQLLVADYQSAFITAATAEAAKYEAERSEDSLIDYLGNVAGSGLLNPVNIPDNSHSDITQASLDAHIKKVQARQIASLSDVQLRQMDEEDQKTYHGRKVRVTPLHTDNGSIESVWFHEQNGYRKGVVKKRHITGIIEEVLLDKNALVLKPTFISKLINPSLQNYIVYIIDPQSAAPTVDLSLL